MDWPHALVVAVLSAALGAAVGAVVKVLFERWLKSRFGA
jgi:hypothetical protein